MTDFIGSLNSSSLLFCQRNCTTRILADLQIYWKSRQSKLSRCQLNVGFRLQPFKGPGRIRGLQLLNSNPGAGVAAPPACSHVFVEIWVFPQDMYLSDIHISTFGLISDWKFCQTLSEYFSLADNRTPDISPGGRNKNSAWKIISNVSRALIFFPMRFSTWIWCTLLISVGFKTKMKDRIG